MANINNIKRALFGGNENPSGKLQSSSELRSNINSIMTKDPKTNPQAEQLKEMAKNNPQFWYDITNLSQDAFAKKYITDNKA